MSTRAMPSHSVATNDSTAIARTRSAVSARDPRRDDQAHAALVVLRGVVVPLRVGDDLADLGGDRIAVPEHAALDLDPVEELLDR